MSTFSNAMSTLERDAFPTRRPVASSIRTVTDSAVLASTIARLFAEPHYKQVRVRITDFGAIHLCFADGTYQIDFPKARLNDALRSRRYVLTAVSSKKSDDDAPAVTGPSSELLWYVGLLPCTEYVIAADAHLRLSHWPNFPTLPHRGEHLQLCALLSGRAMRFDELVAESGMSREVVKSFVVASLLSGCLHASDRAPDFAEDAAPARSITSGGFFDRLRRRFGLRP